VFGPSGAYLGEILLPDRLAVDLRKRDRQIGASSQGSRSRRRQRQRYRRGMPDDLSDFP
jgi:hypothetical protein